MAVLRMNPREFARYHQRLAEEFKPTLLRGIRAGAQRAVSFLVDATRKAPPANPAGIGEGGAVNTGRFLRGWRAKNLPDGAVVTNDRTYGPIIEDGRRAGSKMPPLGEIVAWIMRRLHKSREEAMAMAFVVRRAIAHRGLLGRKILTSDDHQKAIADMVRDEMVHELERAQGKHE